MPSAARLRYLLLAASVLVPAVVFAAAAGWNRAEVLREGADTVERTAAMMHEHAAKVFDTADLVLARINDQLRDAGWDEISDPETSEFLRVMEAPLDQLVSIWVADAQGVVRAGSQPWDADVTIAGREFFRAHRERDAGTYISGAFTGRATATASFALSRRRAMPDGRFDGTVHVALSPQYFARFYREAAPPFAHSALLVRADGEVLARESLHGNPASPARLGADSPLMRAIAARPGGGLGQGTAQADGRTVLFAYRRVASRPIYVVFGADREALLGRWRQNLAAYGAVAGAAALTLLLVAWFALRRERAVQAALRRAAEEGERRLAAEERLRHAGKMEALGQLPGGVAHDFNNAAAAVLAGLALIEKRHGPAIAAAAPDTVPLLAGLREGAERGAAVSRRLLAFARREELRATAVDAAELLRGLRDLLANTLGPGIRLVVDAPPRLPPLRADPAQLQTVLINLAVNARDAMPDGGVVTLGAEARDVPPGSKLWPNDLAPGGYVRLWVADTGLGMDRATLARATEPFFTTKARDRGTGLGLSMADGFAAQSGGALRIESEPGRGTTVSLWLPRAGAASHSPACMRPSH